jgi:type II secretory pathway component GspD/PulD (secretin)
VIRAIAQHARMNYIAPNDADFSEQVTLRYTGNPWQILSILRRRHSFEMTYEDGIWSFYRPDQAELINRTYQLRYTTHLSVKAGAGAGASMGGQEPSANTAGGVAQNSQASTGGAQNIFESSGESLLKNIKTILGIPLSGADMQIAEGGMAGAMPEISVKQRPTVAKQREGGIKSEVIYLADSNQLFIIATRQQHQMIEEYLKRADRPEPLIRIDTRLVETTRDPKSFLGIDPSGWGHPTVKLMDSSTNSSGSGNSGSNTTTTQNQSNLTTPPFDLGKLSSLRPPNTAVLSMSDVSFQLNLLKQDATSRVTNEPRLVTTNNREVSIESVIQEPYASSSQSTQYAGSTSAVGGTTASQLAYTKIGTVINILPQIQKGANGQRIVNLHIVMTVSGKVSDKNIYGQLVPVTSARSYRYNDIQVPDGYTLAIGGLDETTASEAENKIPLAGDIPVVGYLFKSKSKENTRRNLIAYITPTILDFPDAELTKSDYRPLSAGELVPEFAKSKR